MFCFIFCVTLTTILTNPPSLINIQEKFMDWINETHTNTYDFLYLPIDFNNKCNVGFAFINFIDYRFVVSFAEARIGQGW